MRWTPWSTLPLLLALARGAGAQQDPAARAAPVQLVYARGPGAERCPGPEALRAAVSEELGYDPFDPAAARRLFVTLSRRDGDLVVAMSLHNAAGLLVWEESPIRTHGACRVLVSALGVAIAIRLDPEPAPVCKPAKPAPCAEPKPAPCPECRESRLSVWPTEWPMAPLEKPKPTPPPPLERWPVAVRFGISAWAERIATDWGSLAFSAEVGARYSAFSVGIEAHGDPPLGSLTFQNTGPVSFARVSGALVLCAHFGWFAGCGVGDAGRLIFPNHVYALPPWVFYGSAGVRAGLDFPVAPPRLFVRAAFDLRAPVHPVSYTIHGTTIFETAGPTVGLGLGLLAELPSP